MHTCIHLCCLLVKFQTRYPGEQGVFIIMWPIFHYVTQDTNIGRSRHDHNLFWKKSYFFLIKGAKALFVNIFW